MRDAVWQIQQANHSRARRSSRGSARLALSVDPAPARPRRRCRLSLGRSTGPRAGRPASAIRSAAVDLDLVFLGTSGSAPTARRAPSALLVRRGGERLLFDCGEGTQRQLLRSTVGLVDLREIFLTHFHADHYLGLPGMLKTFALRDRDVPLTVYGPPGLRDLFDDARAASSAGSRTALELVELRAGETLERDGYKLLVVPGRARRAGRRLRARRGARGPAASTSRRPTRSACRPGRERGALQRGESITLADGRDAHARRGRSGRRAPGARSSTPATPRRARSSARWPRAPTCSSTRRRSATTRSTRAADTLHSTARQAAELARDAGVRLLALTHISPRYFGPELAARGARGLPGDGRAARLRRDRGAVPRARRARRSSRAARCRSAATRRRARPEQLALVAPDADDGTGA